MSQENNQSNFDLLKGRWTFTNEPPWLKLSIYIATMLFFLALIWMLKAWILPVIATNKFSLTIGKLLKFIQLKR
jgi:hypothetical protein